jgi:hypothetical protein
MLMNAKHSKVMDEFTRASLGENYQNDPQIPPSL